MKNFKIVIRPKSFFTTSISSHTLFGAICFAIKDLYGETELLAFLESYAQNTPDLVISSALPVVDGVVFYPIPQLPIVGDAISRENAKLVKKALYAPLETVKSIMQNGFDSTVIDSIKDTKKIFDNLKSELAIEKVSGIDAGETTPFTVFADNYTKQHAFQILIKASERYSKRIASIFKLLSDKGIGGRKSTGFGHFSYELHSGEVANNLGDVFMTLSRYYPCKTDFEKGNYSIIPLRAKSSLTTTNPWKKPIRLLSEGSVFLSKENKAFYGACPTVKVVGEKQIIEYGLAYPLFFENVDYLMKVI